MPRHGSRGRDGPARMYVLRVAGVSATTGPERGRRLEGWSVRRIVGHVRIQDLSLQEDYRGQPNRAADLHLRAVLVGQVCAAGRHSMRVGGEVVGPLCVGCRRRRCACRDRSAAPAQVGRLCAGRLRGLRAARAVGVLCVAVAVHVPGAVVAGRRPGCGVPTGRCPLESGPGRPIMRAAGSRGWRRLAPSVAGLARPGRRLMRGSWRLTVGVLCVASLWFVVSRIRHPCGSGWRTARRGSLESLPVAMRGSEPGPGARGHRRC